MENLPAWLMNKRPDFLHKSGLGGSAFSNDAQREKTNTLDEDIRFLTRFGVDGTHLVKAQVQAEKLGVPAAQCLMAAGHISETDYYRCVAFELRLPFVHETPDDATPLFEAPSPEAADKMARMVAPNIPSEFSDLSVSGRDIFLAPDCRQLSALKTLVRKNPALADRLHVTTHHANKLWLERRSAMARTRRAIDYLHNNFRQFSARRVISIPQLTTLIIVLQFLLIAALYSTGATLLTLHLIASCFYIGCIWLRLVAAIRFRKIRATARRLHTVRTSDEHLPHYSVLVPIYKEENQVRDLIGALEKIDWPREKLEIKFLCEADDRATMRCVERELQEKSFSHMTLVEVPVSLPRTKPKALNFALPLCRGEFLVVYDAEDRPHPEQLRAAHAQFKTGDIRLACLQAPLSIINHRENWLSGLFGIEYSCLFDGFLPFLSSTNAPIPLGGTSNHFKRSVLVEIGGWDPYNVTEDADLGVRLARAGCQVGMLQHPTYEEAPIDLFVWLKQRTRWFKGWYQTWLVHMRNPLDLLSDLGWKGMLVFQLLMLGMAVSALIHPFLLYLISLRVLELYALGIGALMTPLFLLDVLTVTLGYVSFAALAWRTLPIRNLNHIRPKIWLIPVYWMLLSVAAWRAVWHLLVRPHEWEKTAHRLVLKQHSI